MSRPGLSKVARITIVLVSLASCRRPLQAEVWTQWQQYAQAFIDPHGRVIDYQRRDLTTSEGQAYAMFFALVANDRASFDLLSTWTEKNLAEGDLKERLPAWSWGRTTAGDWAVLDRNSAADADLWMSYDLIEAGRLWSVPEYRQTGRALLARVAREEVIDLPGFGPVLLPAPVGFHPTADTWVLNPSYMPLPLLWSASFEAPSGPWKRMAAGLPELLEQSSPAGFAMDWLTYSPTRGFSPAASSSGRSDQGARGSYDAIRVYLWAGLADEQTPGSVRILRGFPAMARYMNAHAQPPEAVSASGEILSEKGSIGFSAALIPYLARLGMRAALNAQRSRLEAGLAAGTGLHGETPAYYDQNLALFCRGWLEGRFHFGANGALEVGWAK